MRVKACTLTWRSTTKVSRFWRSLFAASSLLGPLSDGSDGDYMETDQVNQGGLETLESGDDTFGGFEDDELHGDTGCKANWYWVAFCAYGTLRGM